MALVSMASKREIPPVRRTGVPLPGTMDVPWPLPNMGGGKQCCMRRGWMGGSIISVVFWLSLQRNCLFELEPTHPNAYLLVPAHGARLYFPDRCCVYCFVITRLGGVVPSVASEYKSLSCGGLTCALFGSRDTPILYQDIIPASG